MTTLALPDEQQHQALPRDLRQQGLVPPEQLASIHATVIGVGAIGRQVALQLACLGVRHLTLFDHDRVSSENLAVQGYWPADLQMPKVEATGRLCRQILPEIQLQTFATRFRKQALVFGERRSVAFCCVDSIQTRKIVWQTCGSEAALWLDGRMNAETLRVLASDERSDPDWYSATLFSEREAIAAPCTARSTIYCASIAAGLMVAQLARWLRGQAIFPDQMLNLLSGELVALRDAC